MPTLLLSILLATSAPAATPCSLEGTGQLEPQSVHSWTWLAVDGDRVRCDLPDYEPLDATCSAPGCTPGPRTLSLWPGRTVELVSSQAPEGGGAIDVEWRAFGPPGEPTELLASRRFDAIPGPLPLQVAEHEARFLRLRRPGVSPETFFLPGFELGEEPALEPGQQAEQIRLEPTWPGPGGEIVGFAEADFLPVSLGLLAVEREASRRKPGDAHWLEPDAYGFFARPALPPGRYRLLALFRGGVELPGPDVEVRGGETSELVPWALPAHGAVDVELAAELCAGVDVDDRLRLQRQRAPRLELPIDERCAWRIEGLAPGRWTLSLDSATGPVKATVDIEAGAVSSAWLESRGIWLEGTVMAGQQPLPELELRLVRSEQARRLNAPGTSTEPETVRTDFDGRFRFDLAAAGPAVLELRSESGFAITSRDVELRLGANVQNFDLGEGRIEVQVSRDDGSELEGEVTIEVWQAGEGRLVRTGQLVVDRESESESPQDRIVIYDLEYARYELTAFSGGGWVTSERTPVELDKGRSEERVELVLEQRRAVATVLDTSGSPVPGLLVAIDRRQLEPTGEAPGEYSLVGASAGSELRILPPPGYVPVCRMLERVESLDVTLQPATAEAWLVPPAGQPPAAGSFLGAIDGLPGSNCAMPVSFLWQLREDPQGRPLVHIRGLVPGTFRFRNADGVVILQVPGPPTLMPGVSQ